MNNEKIIRNVFREIRNQVKIQLNINYILMKEEIEKIQNIRKNLNIYFPNKFNELKIKKMIDDINLKIDELKNTLSEDFEVDFKYKFIEKPHNLTYYVYKYYLKFLKNHNYSRQKLIIISNLKIIILRNILANSNIKNLFGDNWELFYYY